MAPERIEAELARWIGLDPQAVGPAALERACRLGRERLGLVDDEALAARIASDPRERDRLVEDVVVSESWFFRDPASLEYAVAWVAARCRSSSGSKAADRRPPGRLSKTSLPHVMDDVPGVKRPGTQEAFTPGKSPGGQFPRPVRILCAPAAAGEEPRSIAILLLEAGLAEGSFLIDSFDVSRVAVGRAAEGRYSANAFRTAERDADPFPHWFRREGKDRVLEERIRRLAPVAWGNLLDPDFVPPCPSYDVICCRNLMIYLTPQARQDVVRRLDAWLATDGLLLVGSAESSMLLDRFEPAANPSRFVLRRAGGGPRRPAVPAAPAALAVPQTRSARVQTAVAAGPSTGLPPDRRENPDVSAPPGGSERAGGPTGRRLPPSLAAAESLANVGLYAEAIAVCRDLIAHEGPSPATFFLLGTLKRALGAEVDALECFRKAVYLDPGHADAALALALARGARR
jgi:chemotaxis protein methyltransferase WspC